MKVKCCPQYRRSKKKKVFLEKHMQYRNSFNKGIETLYYHWPAITVLLTVPMAYRAARLYQKMLPFTPREKPYWQMAAIAAVLVLWTGNYAVIQRYGSALAGGEGATAMRIISLLVNLMQRAAFVNLVATFLHLSEEELREKVENLYTDAERAERESREKHARREKLRQQVDDLYTDKAERESRGKHAKRVER